MKPILRPPLPALLGLLLQFWPLWGWSQTNTDGEPARYNGFNIANATIPRHEILSGGPPRDGIPSIDKPKFVPANRVTFLRPDDLVVSFQSAGNVRAYPLRILVWHEIVNDLMGTRAIAVTYCPLCGTAMVFDRRVNGRTLDFGVSGLLYQSDVLMYDRQTESLWSQLAMKSVAGRQVNTKLTWLPSEHLTWAAWKKQHPTGEVLSTDTGHRRNYGVQAYAGYEQHEATMFPMPRHRTELANKAWVVGVIVNGEAVAFPMEALRAKGEVEYEVGGRRLRVSFTSVSQAVRVTDIVRDQPEPFVKAYWFAWQAFYPQTRLWQP